MDQLIDPFNRKITYLRVSVTDHCNYRCHYCRGEDHLTNTARDDLLSYEELARIVRLFSELGITKVRLTGGEPLLRKDILKLAIMLGEIPGIDDIPLSTNAHLLSPMAEQLQKAGINRVNISIDSLSQDRFKQITRGGDLDKVIQGIDAAIESGMHPIKLNMVVMRGVNDDEIEAMINFAIERKIDIRFIETMPIGTAGIDAVDHHYSEADILKRIHTHLPNRLVTTKSKQTSGPAKSYLISDTNTSVGTISAVSNNFCSSCNRVRLTAKGRLILCLGQKNSISLRDLLRLGKSDKEIKNMIVDAINRKPEKHEFDTDIDNIDGAQMVEIGG
ncbi:GTP 3',8-cyclase MoaA [Candidatus Thioglobus sp.]|uniref:GTP 3',8-cyclase MoaA n=1 Tax=Candidatus Thioglobus sp. TaxID=2026721 RepID=UPI00261B76BF|nr:GTP 3',8-cyclase MoaA [Candidatus Thioglobus sp.]MDG2395956.1 GTP 3',8-cyclase MoaA [Candidatus Thioglobus sp.]